MAYSGQRPFRAPNVPAFSGERQREAEGPIGGARQLRRLVGRRSLQSWPALKQAAGPRSKAQPGLGLPLHAAPGIIY
jgi:hypothetical protein